MSNVTVPYSEAGQAVFEQLDTYLQTFLLTGDSPELASFPFFLEQNQTLARFTVVGLNARGKLVPATVSETSVQFVANAAVAAGGTGGTNGPAVVTGTTGTGTKFQANVTIAGGAITAVNSMLVEGSYSVPPTVLANEPVTGGGLTGAALSLTMETQVIATPGIQAIGVLTQNVSVPVGVDTQGVAVFYSGNFSIRALVWDASFVSDSSKYNAFRGAPTPTTIVVRKRQSDL